MCSSDLFREGDWGGDPYCKGYRKYCGTERGICAGCESAGNGNGLYGLREYVDGGICGYGSGHALCAELNPGVVRENEEMMI